LPTFVFSSTTVLLKYDNMYFFHLQYL
jgi:hypothetical protein